MVLGITAAIISWRSDEGRLLHSVVTNGGGACGGTCFWLSLTTEIFIWSYVLVLQYLGQLPRLPTSNATVGHHECCSSSCITELIPSLPLYTQRKPYGLTGKTLGTPLAVLHREGRKGGGQGNACCILQGWERGWRGILAGRGAGAEREVPDFPLVSSLFVPCIVMLPLNIHNFFLHTSALVISEL